MSDRETALSEAECARAGVALPTRLLYNAIAFGWYGIDITRLVKREQAES